MNARFATTDWSLVLAAGEIDSTEPREALAALCEDCTGPEAQGPPKTFRDAQASARN